MRGWGPAGVAVVVLTVCLGVGWTVALVATLAYAGSGRPVSREGLAMLTGLGQTLAGALVTLVGVHVGARERRQR